VHAPTDPFPMGALAHTALGKSAPMCIMSLCDRSSTRRCALQRDP